MNATSQTPQCPKWAADLLEKLHRLEVKLGNIIETGKEIDPKEAWHSRDLEDLAQDTEDDAEDGSGADADLAEAIFDRVCAGLVEDGFSPEQIADIVNSRVGKGGRMKYCDAGDVNEALEA